MSGVPIRCEKLNEVAISTSNGNSPAMKPAVVDLILSTWFNFPDLALPDRPDLGAHPHAETAMAALGISYDRAIPSPITESWRFCDCRNVPDKLPKWLSRVKTP